MAESIVNDWLADYAALEPSEIRTFAAQHEDNYEISSALFSIINERIKYPDVSERPFSLNVQINESIYCLDRFCTRYVINYLATIGQMSRN